MPPASPVTPVVYAVIEPRAIPVGPVMALSAALAIELKLVMLATPEARNLSMADCAFVGSAEISKAKVRMLSVMIHFA
jgi:hypothetical protein